MSSSHLISFFKARNIRYFNYTKHSIVCIKLLKPGIKG
jgi:hypothetical protein